MDNMATSAEFAEYVCDRLKSYGTVRSRRMFGEYMFYIDERPVLTACDNTVFVKDLPELGELMSDARRGFPYDGAKEHFILDPDDTELLDRLLPLLIELTPVPLRRKRTTKK
jgi:TfoX/Sxy family transcriptional regulator of competence genes